jgi:hypothetical protein
MSAMGGEVAHSDSRSSCERYEIGLPDDVVVNERGPCSSRLGW